MIVLETLWEIIQSIIIACIALWILYIICEFIDWVEYKMYVKHMNEYLRWKHRYEYDEDLHYQEMMREWNW